MPEGLEIYYYSRFKQQRLVGISGCGRGEWNRGGVELPKSDNGPGPVPWKSCAGFVCFRFVGGSKRSRCCTAFPLPIPTGTISVHVVVCCTDSIAYYSCASGKGTPRSGDRETDDGGYSRAGVHSLTHSLASIGDA